MINVDAFKKPTYAVLSEVKQVSIVKSQFIYSFKKKIFFCGII